MIKNITLTLEASLLNRLRHIAIDHNMSLSGYASYVLTEAAQGEDAYKKKAKRKALLALDQAYSLGGEPMNRDEIHER